MTHQEFEVTYAQRWKALARKEGHRKLFPRNAEEMKTARPGIQGRVRCAATAARREQVVALEGQKTHRELAEMFGVTKNVIKQDFYQIRKDAA